MISDWDKAATLTSYVKQNKMTSPTRIEIISAGPAGLGMRGLFGLCASSTNQPRRLSTLIRILVKRYVSKPLSKNMTAASHGFICCSAETPITGVKTLFEKRFLYRGGGI
jgi:hypothetical protein